MALYMVRTQTAGVYWNPSLGLISFFNPTSNGQWLTMADKNLGATVVYEEGDTLNASNCGNVYQRGNNYGFPFSGTITTSSTTVDASTYGPSNQYSSSTFILATGWDSSNNANLWGYTDRENTGNITKLQGPCLTGYHVPNTSELSKLRMLNKTEDEIRIIYKCPKAGYRSASNGNNTYYGSYCMFWTSRAFSNVNGYCLTWVDSTPGGRAKGEGHSIRPFKDEVVIPDSTWTALFEYYGN